jgi:hypothetical protein
MGYENWARGDDSTRDFVSDFENGKDSLFVLSSCMLTESCSFRTSARNDSKSHVELPTSRIRGTPRPNSTVLASRGGPFEQGEQGGSRASAARQKCARLQHGMWPYQPTAPRPRIQDVTLFSLLPGNRGCRLT